VGGWLGGISRRIVVVLLEIRAVVSSRSGRRGGLPSSEVQDGEPLMGKR
jgi:hypothetical protein